MTNTSGDRITRRKFPLRKIGSANQIPIIDVNKSFLKETSGSGEGDRIDFLIAHCPQKLPPCALTD